MKNKFSTKQKIFWGLYLVSILTNVFVATLFVVLSWAHEEGLDDFVKSPITYWLILNLIYFGLAIYSLFRKSFYSTFRNLLVLNLFFIIPFMFYANETSLIIVLFLISPIPLLSIDYISNKSLGK